MPIRGMLLDHTRPEIPSRTDADQFPDLPVLLSAMERDWLVLADWLEIGPAAARER